MKKIMVIEDDIQLAKEVSQLLENNNYKVHYVTEFTGVVQQVLDCDPDLVLLDINLPHQNGQLLLKELRVKTNIPIIMLTSQDTDMDEVLSMSFGADDFISKPYNPTILLLRIEAIFKRMQQSPSLSYQGVDVIVEKSVLKKDDTEVQLSKNELTILVLFLKHRGKIVSRDEIMNYLWDTNEFIDDNTLTVNINRLRNRLSEIGLDDVIETRRGQGYILI